MSNNLNLPQKLKNNKKKYLNKNKSNLHTKPQVVVNYIQKKYTMYFNIFFSFSLKTNINFDKSRFANQNGCYPLFTTHNAVFVFPQNIT